MKAVPKGADCAFRLVSEYFFKYVAEHLYVVFISWFSMRSDVYALVKRLIKSGASEGRQGQKAALERAPFGERMRSIPATVGERVVASTGLSMVRALTPGPIMKAGVITADSLTGLLCGG